MTEAIPEHIKNNFLYHEIYKRCHFENKNFTLLVAGQVGTSKSYSSIRIAEDLDPNFSIDRVCFSVQELLALMDEGKLKKGSAIIMDESAGSEQNIDSRDFMSQENKIMSFVATTCRALNLFMIFIAPSVKQIDLRTRTIGVGGILILKKVYYKQGYARGDFYWQTFNPRTGKIYTPKPRLYDSETGNRTLVDFVLIPKPSQELITKYEKKKNTFIQDNIKRWRKQLTDKEQKNQTENKTNMETLEETKTKIMKTPTQYKNLRGRFSAHLIQAKIGLSESLSRAVALELNKK